MQLFPQVLVAVLFISTSYFAAIQFEYSPKWSADILVWTPLISAVAIAVAFAIHHFEHARVRVASGVLLFYWLFYVITHGIQLWQLTSMKEYKEHPPRYVAAAVNFGLSVLIFGVEWLIPKKWSGYNAVGFEDDEEYTCPTETSTVFSQLTFGWMTPLMKKGYSKYLTEEDLWDLREKDSTHVTEGKFQKIWQRQLKKKKPSLWITIFTSFGGPFALGAGFKVIQDLLAFVQPQLLRLLIAFISSYHAKDMAPQPLAYGLGIAAAMFLAGVVQTIALHQYFQHAFECGMRIRSSLTATIYRKSMRLSNEGRVTKSTGDIVNLQAVDAQRLQGKLTHQYPYRPVS